MTRWQWALLWAQLFAPIVGLAGAVWLLLFCDERERWATEADETDVERRLKHERT